LLPNEGFKEFIREEPLAKEEKKNLSPKTLTQREEKKFTTELHGVMHGVSRRGKSWEEEIP